jgi:Na+-driven multidrug efflux pump
MVSATLIRREMPSLLRLAVPIVLGEVGWMAMNFVDIAMIGHAGATSLAAVSLGSAIFMVFAIVCEGLLMGSDSLVSQEYGAGNIKECFRTLWAGAQLALPASLLAALLVALSPGILNVIGVPAEIALKARYYLYAMAAGLCRHPRFFAGYASRAHRGLCHDLRQSCELLRQLGTHLRTLPHAGPGRHGQRSGYLHLSHLHDAGAADLPGLAWPPPALAPAAARR